MKTVFINIISEALMEVTTKLRSSSKKFGTWVPMSRKNLLLPSSEENQNGERVNTHRILLQNYLQN
jgi:hypothetical protein